MTWENEQEQNEFTNVGNVESLWLREIYQELLQLKRLLACARDGFSTIPELLQTSPLLLPDIQYRSLRFAITSFYSLLNDVKNEIPPEFYADTQKHLNKMVNVVDNTFDKLIEHKGKTRDKRFNVFQPTLLYYSLIAELESLRSGLMNELEHLFFSGSKKNKGGDFSK